MNFISYMGVFKKYSFFQIALCIAAIIYIFLVPQRILQYAVFYFPLSAFVFIWITNRRVYMLAEYLKLNQPVLYNKGSKFRKYYGKDLFAINPVAITDAEITAIPDKKMGELAKELKLAYRLFFYLFITVFACLIIRAYL